MDDDLWLAAPCAAIKLWNDEGGVRWKANAAALDWGRRAGWTQARWNDVAQRLDAKLKTTGAASHSGVLDSPSLRWSAVPLDAAAPAANGAPAMVVWLQPGTEEGYWSSTSDKLDLVQNFGRLAVWERDLQTGEGRWDEHMFELFSMDPDGPTPHFDIALQRLHPDDRERVGNEYRGYLDTPGRYGSRYRVCMPDGSLRYVHALLEVRAGEDGRARSAIGVMVDDTEGVSRTLAQEAVSAKFAKALSLAKISVWHIDSALKRIVFNDIGYELTGLGAPPDGLTLEAVREVAHPDDREALVRAADEAMRRHGVVDVEARYRNSDGTYRHLLTRRAAERDAQGNVIGLMGISLDQTAQAAERERARQLAHRIELVTEAARVGVWGVDTTTGQVEWNAEMFRIYGLEPGSATPTLQHWLNDLVHPEDRRELFAQRRRAVEQGQLDFEAGFRIVRPDGEVRWVACRSRRELRDGGELAAGIHLDVTEQTQQRERAEQAQRDRATAERASKEKSELLARISHELRTPLNAVLGFAQLLEHDVAHALSPAQLERVGHIRSAGEHLLALIGDVLDLSSIEAGSLPVARAPVSIDAVLGDVASWIAPLAERNRIDVRVEPAGGWVMADAQRLRQIVVNLASDAVKYSSPGGTVWLRSHAAGADGDTGAAGWNICVCDDGKGLTAAEREHLAESFERLDRPHEVGSGGVGLTIVRRLAEFMGGRLDVVSAGGPGSEFRLWLPRAAAPLERVVPEVGEDEAGDASPRLTIHYIEDNPVNVILVKELVAMRPDVGLVCSVDGLSGVQQALADRPDVVLIDMQLPDIDGYEVLKRLRAEPVLAGSSMIALSANGMSDDIVRAKAAGFDDYWTKPIDFRRFLAALDALSAAKTAPKAATH